MSIANIRKALLFGIAGTAVLTAFTYLAGFIRLPRPDLHGIISGLFNTGTIVTWVVYFAVGIVLAYIYKAFLTDYLPFHSWKKGIIFGLIIWGVTQFVLFPIMGMGFLAGGLLAVLGMLVGIVLYGAIVGYLYSHSH